MKKYVKLGLVVAGFLVFLGGVSLLYNKLSAEYKPQQNLVVESGAGTQSFKEGSVNAGNGTGADSMVGADTGGGSSNSAGTGNGTDSSADGQDTGADGYSESDDETGSTTKDTSEQEVSTDESANDTTGQEQSNLAIDFTMENAAGEEVALFDFIGKPIVLNFWASWCGPCKAEIPDFQEVYKKYEGEIEFMMVNMTDGIQETKESAMKFIEEQGYILPFYFDTQLQGAYTYGVYSLPTTFFINAEGEMVAYAQGMIDGETLEQGISMIYGEN